MQNLSLLAGCDMVVSGFAQIQAQLQYRASGCGTEVPVVVGTSRGWGGRALPTNFCPRISVSCEFWCLAHEFLCLATICVPETSWARHKISWAKTTKIRGQGKKNSWARHILGF